MKKSFFLCCAMFLVSAGHAETLREEKIVRTLQGPVRGFKDLDTNIFAFYGIPYAKAPTGKYKFMESRVSPLSVCPAVEGIPGFLNCYELDHHSFRGPLPPPAWLQTFDAVDNKIICPQNAIFQGNEMKAEENCLTANIFLPDTENKKLSVLVYIHGGGFQLGHGNLLTPKELINGRDVIAVTFNYRLGIHGFLCLGTENVPGNAAMKDQVALLRWVKKNIATFGGNPDDVTIAGYSAGSVSVDLLTLSPAARGLFHKAILESGSAVGVIAVQMDPLETAKDFAKAMNFNKIEDIYALEHFYTSASYDLLTSRVYMNSTDSTFGFTPCVENGQAEDAFLTDTPFNILKNRKFNKVPLLYGFANMEGLFRMDYFGHWKDLINVRFFDFLPADLQFDSDEQKQEVAEAVKKFYFSDEDVNDDTIQAYIDYFTDVLFAYPTLKTVELREAAGHKDVYLYEYSFVDAGGFPTGYKDITVEGATHCAQTLAVLDPLEGKPVTEEFQKFQKVIREMWYNFIKKGQPVPEGSSLPAWPAMGADWAPHMSLGNQVELRGSLLLERARFWDTIYERHYRQPVPPPVPPIRHSEL